MVTIECVHFLHGVIKLYNHYPLWNSSLLHIVLINIVDELKRHWDFYETFNKIIIKNLHNIIRRTDIFQTLNKFFYGVPDTIVFGHLCLLYIRVIISKWISLSHEIGRTSSLKKTFLRYVNFVNSTFKLNTFRRVNLRSLSLGQFIGNDTLRPMRVKEGLREVYKLLHPQ